MQFCCAKYLTSAPMRPYAARRSKPILGRAIMAIVAQLVRAPVCGTGGRGFETPRSPHFQNHICWIFKMLGVPETSWGDKSIL